jgi:hypothetical protein
MRFISSLADHTIPLTQKVLHVAGARLERACHKMNIGRTNNVLREEILQECKSHRHAKISRGGGL